MKIIAYASCALNYLPKARVLAKSLRRYHPDADLFLVVNDEWPTWLSKDKEPFTAIWDPSDLGYSRSWVFQHNVMEICTAVKGRALKKILKLAEATPVDIVAYFDPDVCVYSRLEAISAMMGDAEIGLVPHITEPETSELGVAMTELSVAAHGTYNLGHLFLRPGKHSTAFSVWWAERLDKYCYDEKEYGLFTDQRWCDLVPALFDKVSILRYTNIDVASWNFHGRDICKNGDQYTIDGRELLTYHFSGTGPIGNHKRVREALAPSSGALAAIERNYERDIEAAGQRVFERWPYAGDYFDDGTKITESMRKIYRHDPGCQEAFPDPFSTTQERTYLQWLKDVKPETLNGVTLSQAQLRSAFDNLFDEEYYVRRYSDLEPWLSRGKTALDHYVEVGSRLMRDPSVYFDTRFYAGQARGLGDGRIGRVSSGLREDTWLWHYLSTGLCNGIEPNAFFDSRWYVDNNPDVKAALRIGEITSPLGHFRSSGDKEERSPCADFDPKMLELDSEIDQGSRQTAELGRVGRYLAIGRSPAPNI